MNLGWGWERDKRAAGRERRKQQKLESTPKADFCRSSHWRVQNSLMWAHTTVAYVWKMLTHNNIIIKLIKIPSFHWYLVKEVYKIPLVTQEITFLWFMY